MKNQAAFFDGFRAMLPITIGTIPFGAVMGTVSQAADLSLFQAMTMNVLVYAGASQLAALDLMVQQAAIPIIVLTGLIINLRFLLYSAAMTPILAEASWSTKLLSAFTLTDQGYAVMSSNQDRYPRNSDLVTFYLGTAFCMFLIWHLSVMAGYLFGNFSPDSLALDYAVPLSFIALLIPTLKNKKQILVALISAGLSLPLDSLPFRLGLLVTALISLLVAFKLTSKREAA